MESLDELETRVVNAVARLEGELGQRPTSLAIRRLLAPPPSREWNALQSAAERAAGKGALIRFNDRQDVIYKLSLDGWLQSDKSSAVKDMVSGFVRAFRAKLEQDFSAAQITYQDLRAVGVTSVVNLAISAGSTLHLWANGTTAGDDSTFGRPHDLDAVVAFDRPEQFLEYRRKNPPERVAYFNDLERHADANTRRALGIVYEEFLRTARWPSTRHVNVKFHRQKLDLARIVNQGRFLRGGDISDPNAVTAVSLEGLLFVSDAAEDRRDIQRLLTFLGNEYAQDPDLRELEPKRVMEQLGLDAGDLAHLATILANQWSSFVALNGNGFSSETSRFYVDHDHLDFLDAESFEDIVYAIYHRRIERNAAREIPVVVDEEEPQQDVALPPLPPLAGLSFGDWRVIAPLRRDGQGEVFYVAHTQGGFGPGVLKRIPKELSGDPKRLLRFKHEIQFTQRLRHPCIAQVLDISLEDEMWFVTRYAPFGSLLDNLEWFRGDVWRSLRLARDMATALRTAHAQSIIHRDVKPGNVLVYSADHFALTDFGIAHHPDHTQATSKGEKVGPGWFLPPEAEHGRSDDVEPAPTHDVYMLGKLIYFTLTGGERFVRERYAEGRANIVEMFDRPELSIINKKLFAHMIAEDPAQRFAKMDDVIRELDLVLASIFGGSSNLASPQLVFRFTKSAAGAGSGDHPGLHDVSLWLPRDASLLRVDIDIARDATYSISMWSKDATVVNAHQLGQGSHLIKLPSQAGAKWYKLRVTSKDWGTTYVNSLTVHSLSEML